MQLKLNRYYAKIFKKKKRKDKSIKTKYKNPNKKMVEGDPTKLVKCVRENWAQIILSVGWVCFADKPLRLIYFSALSLSGSYWPDYRLFFYCHITSFFIFLFL